MTNGICFLFALWNFASQCDFALAGLTIAGPSPSSPEELASRFIYTKVSPAQGSSRYVAGGVFDVSWSSAGLAAGSTALKIGLSLYEGSAFLYGLQIVTAANSSRSGPFVAVFYPILGSGQDYRVRAYDFNNASFYNYSSYFTLASTGSPSIQVAVPKSTQQFRTGDLLTVAWVCSGLNSNLVNIFLYKAGIAVVILQQNVLGVVIEDDLFGKTFPLNQTLQSGNDYRVKVVSNGDPTIFSFSSAFIINGRTGVSSSSNTTVSRASSSCQCTCCQGTNCIPALAGSISNCTYKACACTNVACSTQFPTVCPESGGNGVNNALFHTQSSSSTTIAASIKRNAATCLHVKELLYSFYCFVLCTFFPVIILL